MNKDKIKILYIITKSNWGGAQRYIYDLSEDNQNINTEIVIACGGQGVLKDKLENIGIRTIEIKNLGRDIKISSDWSVFKELIKIFREEKPDIIHLNSSKIGGLGVLAGRIVGIKKIIFTAHGWPFNEDRNLFFKATTWLLSLITVILSHKTIVICKHDERQILSIPFISHKIILIHNGVEKITDLKEKEEARKFLLEKVTNENIEDPNKKIWIGTISELHKNKGLEYTILAFKKIPKENNAIFVIIGEGEERWKLEKIIARENLKKKIFLVGHIDEASKYLKAFDIFTLTSLKEGLPYVLLEAGTASLPVITSKVGGIPEIIDDMESGILTTPKDIEKISSSMQFLIKNEESRIKFGKKLNQTIQEKFSFAKMSKKTLEVYLNA